MRIEAIYLPTHKHDLRLTRICVASIRYWYPDIPIYLIKDEIGGSFSTQEIERHWNVGVMATAERAFGWGFAKFEPFFATPRHRFMVMDVDIVFVGRVIDALERHSEDFVVDDEVHPDPPGERFQGLYFHLDALRQWDPGFTFPNFAFNSGQFVGTSGLLSKADFNGLIRWTWPRATMKPEIFNHSDQGVLNFLVMKKLAAGEISVARVPFMKWGEEEMNEFDLERIDANSPYPFLIHWAGLRKRRMKHMLRSDILFKFEDFYYSRIPLAVPKRRLRVALARVLNLVNRISGKLQHRTIPRYLE